MSGKFPGGFVTASAPAGFSVAFDGTGDYLTVATNANLILGTGAFTIEAWFYVSVGNTEGVLSCIDSGSGSYGIGIYFPTTTTFRVAIQSNSTGAANFDSTVTTGKWYHVAAVRDGSNNFSAFLNGSRIGTTTNTTNISLGAWGIARLYANSGSSYNGYISNVRIVKGTAVYDPTATTINVPTQLFPVTNTQLLTCQSPTIIDNSSNAYTITVNGDAKVSNFTPFAAYQGFNPALGAAAGGVWTLDEAAYYQNNRQWPIYDPYFNQTTLMLHGNGTNAAQNNTFLDSSTNNFTITRNGNTTQGSFSPFSQTGWSSWFDGTGDRLTTPSNTAFTLGTGDYTYECWVYHTDISIQQTYFARGSTGNYNGVYFYKANTTNLIGVYYTSQIVTSSTAIEANRWYHLVACRASGTLRLFINGVQVGSSADTTNLTESIVQVGADADGTNGVKGYMSNARVIKGVALYTANFTPPTAPLTAVTGTSLLTCQDNRFVDDSANNFALTVNGTPSVQAFSPFVPAYITPTTYSNWFNSSTGYLSTGTSLYNYTTANASTQTATFEAWVYTTSYGSPSQPYYSESIVSKGDVYMNFGINGSGNLVLTHFDGTQRSVTSSGTIALNTWTYVACTISGGVVTLYINGSSSGTGTWYGIAAGGQNSASQIGLAGGTGSGGIFFRGNISNVRVSTTARTITVPIAPYVNDANTSLLTCQSSTFVDNSTNAFTITATGNVQPVTSPTPFPAKVDTTTLNSAYSTSLIGGSAYFDGTGDYLSFSGPTIGTGAFCLEAWVYCTSTFSNQTIFGADGTNNRISIKINSSTVISVDQYGVSASNFTVSAMALNAWNHIAVSRNGSSVATVFVNGVRSSTGTATLSNNYTTFNAIGRFDSGTGYYLTGYISGARAIIGSTPYDPTQTGFAPPIAPPTPVTNTQLLTNFTNGAIFDNTAKNVLETVSGASLSTAQVKYGTTSMAFNGSSDYVVTPSSRLVSAWSGDCTIEGWYYTTSIANTPPLWMNSTSNSDGMTGGYVYSDGRVGIGKIGGSDLYSAVGLWSNNRWNHVAYVKAGATAYIFLNGIIVASGTATTYFETTTTKPMTLGRNYQNTSAYYSGYISDFRVTQGVARYITNFTPPTSQLQDQ